MAVDEDGRGGSSPARSYVLCSNPRSGTTYLCALLRSTGVLGQPDEWLRGDGMSVASRYDPYPTDFEKQFQLMLREGSTPNGVCGLKMFPYHSDMTLGVRWAERMPRLKFIHFVRQDLLGQAISLSIARQTQSYIHWLPAQAAAVYSRKHIARCMDWLAIGDARWNQFFARNGIDPLILTYDQLCADPQAVVSAIGRHVGAPDATIGPRHLEPRIQRDGRNAEWRARFIAESRDLNGPPQLQGVTYAEHMWRPEDAEDVRATPSPKGTTAMLSLSAVRAKLSAG
jgi:trehalose 2-sulfotransferase